MPQHSYHTLDLDKLVSKGFTGSGKKKFIHAGKSVFKDEAKEAAGRKDIKGRKGGNPQSTDGGVSLETGYRNRSAPGSKPAPGAI